ncbi:hypothetical protein SDRG_08033 [Saprolegnia diclina VS20]|uniref:Uncharacterized protein n=1 Tax=Saprolegnia diclina (strain VS20) TaxID=1156394 RepID=T0QHN1_SAPDV|nr:hypothetical protein SDRG_08033 [Saprolegnia diclina VS20]EQC34261.1 hypothetical protein SDRG_08033 [Saprolegnia diclina VS20]|eukprot:XP_008612123.1 hypothetical protein SDRG_08033 [Saprolegnia diclina VS20]
MAMTAMPPDGAMTPAMALDHVPLFIVQCLRSHHDVTAFLRALPANSLSVPLAALLELLSKSRTVRARWPEILPEFLGPKRSKLALTALPALPSIYVYDTIYWYDSSLQSTARARQWLANVMHLGKTIDSSTLDAFTSHVAQYKRLESLSVHVDTLGDLATSLPPRLRHLMLVGDDISDDDYDDFDDDDAEGEDGSAYAGSEGDVDSDLATALHRWLDNGRSHNNLTVDGLLSKVHAAAVAGSSS